MKKVLISSILILSYFNLFSQNNIGAFLDTNYYYVYRIDSICYTLWTDIEYKKNQQYIVIPKEPDSGNIIQYYTDSTAPGSDERKIIKNLIHTGSYFISEKWYDTRGVVLYLNSYQGNNEFKKLEYFYNNESIGKPNIKFWTYENNIECGCAAKVTEYLTRVN